MMKPKLSFWQIWNMSFGFLGIQFGFGLQNANVSRIFQSLGAEIDKIPILWLAAPLTGLIVQPIIGHLSDNTWGRLGRRRPYFLAGAILASAALIIMPHSPVLWIAVGMLWIMDASINISMEPFRAFVGDMLPDEQRTKGFAMQSVFIGIGAVIASALPYMLANWTGIDKAVDEDNIITPSLIWSFFIGGIVFFSCVFWTVVKTREYSPEELKAFEEHERKEGEYEVVEYHPRTPGFFIAAVIWLLTGLLLVYPIYRLKLEQELYIIAFGLTFFGILLLAAGIFNYYRKKNGLTEVLTDLFNMPQTMRQLAVVQFFSWLALFSMWIYTTPAITSHIYGVTDPEVQKEIYNEGSNWVGVLFGFYNGFAAIFAFTVLPRLARITSRKAAHAISLVLGGIGLISLYFIPDPKLLILSMVGVGMAWASILSLPYAILTGSLPQNRMGTFMGIFNFFIVIPQILAASILGFLLNRLFGGEAILTLIFGGISMIIGAIAVIFVKDIKGSKKK